MTCAKCGGSKRVPCGYYKPGRTAGSYCMAPGPLDFHEFTHCPAGADEDCTVPCPVCASKRVPCPHMVGEMAPGVGALCGLVMEHNTTHVDCPADKAGELHCYLPCPECSSGIEVTEYDGPVPVADGTVLRQFENDNGKFNMVVRGGSVSVVPECASGEGGDSDPSQRNIRETNRRIDRIKELESALAAEREQWARLRAKVQRDYDHMGSPDGAKTYAGIVLAEMDREEGK